MARLISSKYLLRGLALACTCAILERLGVRIHSISGSSPLFWAPSGIGFAALLLWGLEYWPWIFLASLITGIFSNSPLYSVFVVAAGEALGPWIGAQAFRKFSPSKPTLTQLPEVGILVIGVMGFSALLSSTLQVFGFYLGGRLPADQLFGAWRSWWLGSAVADLVLGGALIAWYNDIYFRLDRLLEKKWEALFLFVAISGFSIFIYTPLAVHNHSLVVKPYFLFTLMLWASLRFELLGATTTSLIITAAAITGMLLGYSAFATNAPTERMVVMQMFSAALGTTGLVIAAAMREKMEAVEARNEFLSIASHELKTPITSLKLQLQLSLKRLSAQTGRSPADEVQLNWLKKLDKQVIRLVQIIEQLLDISRIERRTLALQLDETDLSTLIKNLVERLSSDLTQARCEVQLDLPASAVLRCDAFRMEQVFENLMSNSIKYAPGNPIRVALARSENQLQISVTDQGPGIERSKLPFIFDRFVRASESPHVKGLGLGLFITRQIVQAHGGTITVDSPEGRGTVFLVNLPNA